MLIIINNRTISGPEYALIITKQLDHIKTRRPIVTILKPMIIIAVIPLLIGIAGIFLLAIAVDAIKNPLTKPQITFTGKRLPPLN